MNKRFFVISVIVVLVMLATGCGNSSTASAPVLVKPTPVVIATGFGKVVFVSPGEFYIGRNQKQIDDDYTACMQMVRRTNQSDGLCNPKNEIFGDNPYRKVTLYLGLWVDTAEISGGDRLPISGSYDDISAICIKRGGRLPTDIEWEIFATYDGSEWPWGPFPPDRLRANIDLEGGHPNGKFVTSGVFPGDINSLGLRDLIGNIAEWTVEKHLRGGGYGTYTIFAKPSHITTALKWGGGRCGYDIKPK